MAAINSRDSSAKTPTSTIIRGFSHPRRIVGIAIGIVGCLLIAASALLYHRECNFLSHAQFLTGTVNGVDSRYNPEIDETEYVPWFMFTDGRGSYWEHVDYPCRVRTTDRLAFHNGDVAVFIYGTGTNFRAPELDGFWTRWRPTIRTALYGLLTTGVGSLLAFIPVRPPVPGRAVRRLLRHRLEQRAELVVERP